MSDDTGPVGHRTWAILEGVVQHSRLGSRRPVNALLNTVAFPVTG